MRLLYRKGFTLIELLVVVSIIGVLASIIISSINEARLKAKQAKFTQTLTSLQTALELYYLDNGEYPTAGITTPNSTTYGAFINLKNGAYEYAGNTFATQMAPYFDISLIQDTASDDTYIAVPSNQPRRLMYYPYDNSVRLSQSNYINCNQEDSPSGIGQTYHIVFYSSDNDAFENLIVPYNGLSFLPVNRCLVPKGNRIIEQ